MLKLFKTIVFVICTVGVVTWAFVVRPFAASFTSLSFQASRTITQANAENLERDTFRLSRDFLPRDFEHPDNLDRAAAFIADQLKLTNSRVSLQTYSVHDTNYSNVISEYGPADSKSTVVIGAHYDAFGAFDAADDNASGVAGIIELGRLFSSAPLNHRVTLVAYTLEEPPHFAEATMGSAIHAASLKEKGEHVRLMISLEMIGYFSDMPDSQSYPIDVLGLFYPSQGNFIAIVGNMTFSPTTFLIKRSFAQTVSLPVRSINAPTWVRGIDYSDHKNYWAHGFDAVMITDTAFLRNRAYHTSADTADRLDYGKMADVVTGVFHYVLSLNDNTPK